MTDTEKEKLLEAALEIAAAGVPVFPCSAEKNPVCTGGFKAATMDPNRIRSLFAHSAAALIGMPTGRASGFNVLDVDPRHGGDAWLDANRGRLPATRTVKTKGGGLHLYFQLSVVELRNSAGKSKSGKGIADGIDIRGEGGYVIVPPSGGYIIADARPPAAMPDWLTDLCRKPADNPPPPPPRPATARPQGEIPAFSSVALDSACAAIRNAPEGSKHETLNREAYAIGGLVGGGELPEGMAYPALLDALHALRDRGTIKDFRAAEKTLRQAFASGKAKPRHVPELPGRVPADEGGVDISAFMAKFADEAAAIQRAAAAKPLPVEDFLYDVPGVMQNWLDYCEGTARSPQPFLALAAGITAIGALAGRKYESFTEARSNFYCIGVADSGGGKDHARRCIKKAFAAAGLTHFLGGEEIASGTAIITALLRHPCILFQIDEAGDWLGDILGSKAPQHRKQIAQRLKTLYSSAGTFMAGTEYADQSKAGKPRQDIHDPHACLYGTTTPQQFWQSFQTASLSDGLLARFLIFVSPESYPDRNDINRMDPPAALVEGFQAIAAGVPGAQGGNLSREMIAGVQSSPYVVPATDEARAAFKELENAQLERQRAAAGTYVTSIVGRWAENASKLALVRAISRNPVAPVMEAGDIAWGRAVAEHCIDTLLREADDNVADTPYQRNVQKALKVIKKEGRPITLSQMTRKGWVIPEREQLEILRTLVGTGQIVAEQNDTTSGGRPTIRYSIGKI